MPINGSALLLLAAGSVSVAAQPAAARDPTPVLPTVRAQASAEPSSHESVRSGTTAIGKGTQELRDVPQSLTVVTQRLIDDRNLDTLKEALKNTAGISFLAAEGGEEDIRLRGFALQGTGDVFVDGMRDPAFYERDTFFYDRLEVLRGSASMLFGRGSTGGAVNQVSKLPRALTEHQIDLTLGNHRYSRLVGDFNFRLGESAALRVGAMATQADNSGAGTPLDKQGAAATLRWGTGTRNEFSLAGYMLHNDNGMNYGLPWIRPTPTADASQTTLLPVDLTTCYGLASDINAGQAATLTATHTHRFDRQHELTTKVRHGAYERDQRASAVRLGAAALQPARVAASLATFGSNTVLARGTPLKIQDLDIWLVQSDYSGSFKALGLRHDVQAGVDLAREEKVVYAARNAAQGGVLLVKPTTTASTPADGAQVDESLRVLRTNNDYTSVGGGADLQDLIQITPS